VCQLFEPTYNAASTQKLPIIINQSPQDIQLASWGLKPAWLKDRPEGFIQRHKNLIPGAGFVNARAETLSEKPAFREAFKRRRCLVIASGFYEWDKKSKVKTPYYFKKIDNGLFAFASLYEQADNQTTFAILTCGPNMLVHRIHERMPVILQPDDENHGWIIRLIPRP